MVHVAAVTPPYDPAMTLRAALSLAVVAGALAAALPTAALAASSASSATWAGSAKAICKRYGAEVNKVKEPTTMVEAADSTQAVFAIATKQTREIAKLPRPAKTAADIATLITLWEQQLGVVKQMVTAYRTQDEALAEKLVAKGTAVDVKVKALGKKLGVTTCVS